MYSRNVTRLPDMKMIDTLLSIIFSPSVTFDKDEHEVSYSHYNLVGEANCHELHYYFGNNDLLTINYIRLKASQIVSKVMERTNLKSLKSEFREKLINYLRKDKFRKLTNSSFNRLFETIHKFQPGSRLRIKEIKGQNKNVEDSSINRVVMHEIADGKNIYFKYAKTGTDFLPALEKQPLINDYSENLTICEPILREERKKFGKIYEYLNEQYERFATLINNPRARFVCKACGETICSLEAAKYLEVDGLGKTVQISGALSFSVKFVDIVEGEENNNYLAAEFKRRNIPKPEKWIYCFKQEHVVGVRIGDLSYLVEFSEIAFINQLGTVRNVDGISEECFKELKADSDRAKFRRKDELKQMKCELCNYKNDNEVAFLQHLKKNKEHRINMHELWQFKG